MSQNTQWGPIREQTKAIIAGVSGMGRVHDFLRLGELAAFYKDANGKINGCAITRVRTPERWLSNIEYQRVFEMVIRGYYGWSDKDATELIVQDLIEAICDDFRGNDTLNDTCETTCPEFGQMRGVSGMQVEIVEPRMFGGTLCHYYELRLGAQIRGSR